LGAGVRKGTCIYTYVSNKNICKVKSSLDNLQIKGEEYGELLFGRGRNESEKAVRNPHAT